MHDNQSWLSWFLRGILIVLFLILVAKLVDVQIIKGSYYRKLSEENRIRQVPIPAPRGKILARGGEVLAGNLEVNKRVIFGETGFSLSDETEGASPEEIVTDYKRYYPMGEDFSHAVGYLAKPSESEAGKIDPKCPGKGPIASDSLVGKTGLEEEYNCLLSGTPGQKVIEVDASGHELRVLGKIDPIPGRDLQTTIDYTLQSEVARQLGDKKGAVIVSTPEGQILAFYSYPTFDPNIFVTKGNSEEISRLLNDSDLPFFDRVISGTFHPGSTFKLVTAIAALEEGLIDKYFTFDDMGVIKVNEYSYANWLFTKYGGTEGSINLVRAIARSTDTFFYTIGQMVGPDNIAKWAGYFGLDRKTGIDIPGEVAGLIPTPAWKEETKKESWYLGNTYHMSIGQGDVAVTPIEINTYISAIASGGSLCSPQFSMHKSPSCRKVKLSQETLKLVKEGMEQACSSGGTANTFFDFTNKYQGTTVACKTGTAEVETDGTPHAWFTFFAPADNPQIVATVLVEKGGEGSSVAGPIARKIADFYFASFAN